DPVDAGAFQRLILVSAGGGAVQELDHGDRGTPLVFRALAWSPDSRRLAYTLSARGGMSHIDELRVREVDGARAIELAGKLDLELGELAWAGDSRSILVSAIVRTVSKLYRFPIDGGPAREIPIGKRVLSMMSGDASGRYLVASSSTSAVPREPAVID